MKLRVDLTGTLLKGKLRYHATDHAFDFTPGQFGEARARTAWLKTASLALGTLQLEFDVAGGTIQYAWGYSGQSRWHSRRLPEPELIAGVVYVDQDAVAQPGAAVEFAAAKQWGVAYDRETGWLYFGDEPIGISAIEIASGIGLVINSGVLRGVWLHPSFEL